MNHLWTFTLLTFALSSGNAWSDCDVKILSGKTWILQKYYSNDGKNIDDDSMIYRDGWIKFEILPRSSSRLENTDSNQKIYLRVSEMVFESTDEITGTALTSTMKGSLDTHTCIMNLQWEQILRQPAEFIAGEPQIRTGGDTTSFPAHTTYDRTLKIINTAYVNQDTYQLEILLCDQNDCEKGNTRRFGAIDMLNRRNYD